MKTIAIAAGTLALSLMLSAPASAATTFTFDTVGDTALIDFNGIVEGVVDPDLDADLLLSLASISGSTFTFDYTLTNNSVGDDAGSKLTAFGFNVDPNFLSASVAPGGTFTTVSSGNVPGNLPNVEFCLTNVNCSGGKANLGVAVGSPGSGTFSLTFADGTTSVTFSDLYVRYQSLANDGSGVGVGGGCVGPACDGGGGGQGVPEPASWAMMILGFGAAGSLLRRRRHLAAA
jgi:hypothetical protein